MRAGDYVEVRAFDSNTVDAYGFAVSTYKDEATGHTYVDLDVRETFNLVFSLGNAKFPLTACYRVIPLAYVPIWRCTRPTVYGPTTPGHMDKRARQGHYVTAMTILGAHQQMSRQFPSDAQFDIDPWQHVQWMTVGTGTKAKAKLLRSLSLPELRALATRDHVYLVIAGRGETAYNVKINGMPKTWRTRPNEVAVPYRYGLHHFGHITHLNVLHEQVLVEVAQ